MRANKEKGHASGQKGPPTIPRQPPDEIPTREPGPEVQPSQAPPEHEFAPGKSDPEISPPPDPNVNPPEPPEVVPPSRA